MERERRGMISLQPSVGAGRIMYRGAMKLLPRGCQALCASCHGAPVGPDRFMTLEWRCMSSGDLPLPHNDETRGSFSYDYCLLFPVQASRLVSREMIQGQRGSQLSSSLAFVCVS